MRDMVAIIHRDGQSCPDYLVVLTFEYQQETGQWVGVCLELGTSSFSTSLEEVRDELREAVELQLNELERLTQVRDYLADNHVRIVSIEPDVNSRQTGFAAAADSR